MCATLNRRWLTRKQLDNWTRRSISGPRLNLNLSTGCFPPPPATLSVCHSGTLPLGCCCCVCLSQHHPVSSSRLLFFSLFLPTYTFSQWLHFMCRFLLRGCSLQFRELSELIGRWFERAALCCLNDRLYQHFHFGLKLIYISLSETLSPFVAVCVDKCRFSGHSSSSLNSSLIFSWLYYELQL